MTKAKLFAIIYKSSEDDAGMAQLVEHVIGNDEVISSTLIASSKKATQSGCFFIFFQRLGMSFCQDAENRRLVGVPAIKQYFTSY